MNTGPRVVDTSAWVEWLIGSTLGKKIGSELPERSNWIVPTIIQIELANWLAREGRDDEADQVIAFTQKCHVVPLDTTLALAAADLHRVHGLATADAIVLATALEAGADLLTCDAHFGSLPGVVYLAKGGRR